MACSFASSTGPRLKACAAIGDWAQLDEAAAVTVATVGTGCGPPTAATAVAAAGVFASVAADVAAVAAVAALAAEAARVTTLAANVAVPGADSTADGADDDDAVAVP